MNNGVNWVKELNVNRSQILMIGDTEHDFEVAEAIGIDCILLSHGHHNHSRLKKTGVPVFRNFTEQLLCVYSDQLGKLFCGHASDQFRGGESDLLPQQFLL